MNAGGLGEERDPPLRPRQEPNAPDGVADEAKLNGVGLDQRERGERTRGVGAADARAVELLEVSIEEHDRQLILEGHVVRGEEDAEGVPLDGALEDRAGDVLSSRHTIDEDLALGRLILVGPGETL